MALATIIHGDTISTLDLSGTNQQWVLAEDASIEIDATDQFGVNVFEGEGNSVTINGRVSLGYGATVDALQVRTDNTSVIIGAAAFLTGSTGISGNARHLTLTNAGTVIGTGQVGVGIRLDNLGDGDGTVEIRNSGFLYGDAGAMVSAEYGKVINAKGGEIIGIQCGVFNGGGADGAAGSVTNHGIIRTAGHSSNAVYMSNGDDRVVNDGALYGEVTLNGGDDWFDNRGGYVDGEIHGGSGNDTLIVDKAAYRLIEVADGGDMDTVRSSVSYRLSDNVEKLVLIGSADIKGIGTGLGDFLYGNSGKNVLRGLAGSDALYGGKGNDHLTGGADADVFHFAAGDGKDTITDFEHGVDTIDLSDWKAITNFRQVKNHAVDHGTDVWIADGGDTLIVKHLHKADLAGGDFHFL